MALTDKEKIVAIISNGIAVFSLLQERGSLPENTTMYDFVLKVVPDNIKSELSTELIDEVFQYVSSAHSS
jgi:3-methyladenine DNA glycosylase Tag